MQTLEDTAGSRQTRIPTDKASVLVKRDGTVRLLAVPQYLPVFSACQEHNQRRFYIVSCA